MSGKVNRFQLGCHLFTNFNWRDNIDNVEDLFDNELAGDNVGNQFIVRVRF